MTPRRRKPASHRSPGPHIGTTRSYTIPLATSIAVLAVSFIGALVLIDAGAYGTPSANPPNGNTLEPLNIGVVSQSKSGDLGATTFFDSDDTNYFLNPTGLSTLKGSPDSTDPTRTIALDVNDSIIENVKDPQRDQDVATKAYVDGVAGLSDQSRGALMKDNYLHKSTNQVSLFDLNTSGQDTHIATVQDLYNIVYLDSNFNELFTVNTAINFYWSVAIDALAVADERGAIYVGGFRTAQGPIQYYRMAAFDTNGIELYQEDTQLLANRPTYLTANNQQAHIISRQNAFNNSSAIIVKRYDETGLLSTNSYTVPFTIDKYIRLRDDGTYVAIDTDWQTLYELDSEFVVTNEYDLQSLFDIAIRTNTEHLKTDAQGNIYAGGKLRNTSGLDQHGKLCKIEKTTGATAFCYTTAERVGDFIFSPTIDGGAVLIYVDIDKVVHIDRLDGDGGTVWERTEVPAAVTYVDIQADNQSVSYQLIVNGDVSTSPFGGGGFAVPLPDGLTKRLP